MRFLAVCVHILCRSRLYSPFAWSVVFPVVSVNAMSVGGIASVLSLEEACGRQWLGEYDVAVESLVASCMIGMRPVL